MNVTIPNNYYNMISRCDNLKNTRLLKGRSYLKQILLVLKRMGLCLSPSLERLKAYLVRTGVRKVAN